MKPKEGILFDVINDNTVVLRKAVKGRVKKHSTKEYNSVSVHLFDVEYLAELKKINDKLDEQNTQTFKQIALKKVTNFLFN